MPDSVRKEVLAELVAMREASRKADWSQLKRFFPEGTKWAELAEGWIKETDPHRNLTFFARGAETFEKDISIRVVNRDLVEILAPYFVDNDVATFGAKLERKQGGWVLACSHESHGSLQTFPGCATVTP